MGAPPIRHSRESGNPRAVRLWAIADFALLLAFTLTWYDRVVQEGSARRLLKEEIVHLYDTAGCFGLLS